MWHIRIQILLEILSWKALPAENFIFLRGLKVFETN